MKQLLLICCLFGTCITAASAQSERAKRFVEQRPGAVIKQAETNPARQTAVKSDKEKSLPSSAAATPVERTAKPEPGNQGQEIQQNGMQQSPARKEGQ